MLKSSQKELNKDPGLAAVYEESPAGRFYLAHTISFPESFDAIPQQEPEMRKPEPFIGKFDPRRFAGAIVHRDYVNQLLGF